MVCVYDVCMYMHAAGILSRFCSEVAGAEGRGTRQVKQVCDTLDSLNLQN